MPLSDHEQRLLDEIEQALYAEDPKFAASVRSARTRRSRTHRSAALCIVGVLAGLALVLVGLIATIIALSVVGFVLLVASCGYAVQIVRGRRNGSPAPAPTRTGASRAPRASGLRSRMAARIRRRFDDPQS